MSHITRHASYDVAGRVGQGLMIGHSALQGILDGLEDLRIQKLDAVEQVVEELGRARRAAAAARADAAQARQQVVVLQQQNAALVYEARHAVARAEKAEAIARRVIDAVQRDQAAQAAAA